MATAAVTYSFVPNTDIEAAEVNANFQNLVDFLNTHAVQKDASLAFTNIPSGPASDPVSANQLSRKAYVDAQDLKALRALTGGGTWKGWTNPTLDPSTVNLVYQAGYQTVTLDSNGHVTVTFPKVFPNGIVTVLMCLGDELNNLTSNNNLAGDPHKHTLPYVDLFTTSNFLFSSGGGVTSANMVISWVAIGY